ncbi:MAG: hypothetical protein IT450_20270 [Phycisphaerales bacterium]|nr:hypothetical protein [Phycisphaerales bacterium]
MVSVRSSVIAFICIALSHAQAGDLCEFLPGGGVRGLGHGVESFARANCSAIFDYGAGPMLFVGGEFTLGGPEPVSNIARWDGSRWNALVDGGVNNEVTAMCVFGGELYVAGSFTEAGGSPARFVARWDGGQWRAVGNITEQFPTINAMVEYDGKLICGGNIRTIGGVEINGLASWSGSSWSAYGGGLSEQSGPGEVHALLVDGNHLYVAGALDGAGPITVANIARFDRTTGLWDDLDGGCGLPTGATEWVYSLAKRNNDIFAIGTFTRAGGDTNIQKIARWNGTSWLAAGSAYRYGNRLGMNGNNLFAEMQVVDGASGMAKWNGTGWDEVVGAPAVTAIANFASYNSDLIVLGDFGEAGGKGARNIARFGGVNWFNMGAGTNARVTGFSTFQGQPIAFGEFRVLDGAVSDYIARWDGTAWQPFAPGLIAPPLCAVDTGSLLIIGGTGTLTNVAGTDGVAAWNGTSWVAIDGGFGLTPSVCSVRSLAIFANRLYAGGFNLHMGQVTDYIAQLDNGNWVPVAGGTNGTVYAMTPYLGRLIVGGRFADAGGVAAMNIAAWNGAGWDALGVGLGDTSDTVSALEVHAGVLVAGGNFNLPFAGNPRGLAAWNGTQWVPVDDEYYNTAATALFSHDGELYVAGTYFDPNMFPGLNLNRYAGGAWTNVDGGTDGRVYGLGADGAELLVGGDFMMAGGEVSAYLARLGCVPGVVGDTDGDGDVDIQDLANLLAHFGACAPDPSYDSAADFDNDNCVSLQDLALLLANFGT